MDDSAATKAIRKALIAMREAHGYTRSEVADSVSTSPGAVRQWENGATTPSIKNVYALAALYEVPPGDLLPPVDAPKKRSPKKLTLEQRVAQLEDQVNRRHTGGKKGS